MLLLQDSSTDPAATPWPAVATLLGVGWAVAAVVMGALWARQTRTRDATVVDVAWSALLGTFAIAYAAFANGDPLRRALVAGTVGAATFRLAWTLYFHRARSGIEDARYAALREKWGERAQIGFFAVFQFQALLAAVLSLPFALAVTSSTPLGAPDFAALAVWTVGVVGESIADRQLAHFKRQPGSRGKTCDQGLWRFSRHPNYFFEWCMWIAYALFALSAPLGIAGFSAPALMLVLILFVTGIPPAEAQAIKSRGDDYRRYQRTTSAFVPWFPKRTNA